MEDTMVDTLLEQVQGILDILNENPDEDFFIVDELAQQIKDELERIAEE